MIQEMKELMPGFKDGFFMTNDEVKLHYIEGGEGTPLILTSGWPTSPALFTYNLPAFAKYYHVFALENRGTGESERPDYGYRVSRTAMDVYNLMQANGIEKAVFMGHSMGCSTIWAFIDLFGQNMIDKLVLCDQAPWLWCNEAESDESMKEHCGHRGSPYGLYNAYAESWTEGRKKYAEPEYWGKISNEWMARTTLTGDMCNKLEMQLREPPYNNEQLARLLVNHYMTDWRDIIQQIRVPTLVISGEISHAMTAESVKWMEDVIPGCESYIFSEEDYGSHMMMSNSPELYNRVVLDFLARK